MVKKCNISAKHWKLFIGNREFYSGNVTITPHETCNLGVTCTHSFLWSGCLPGLHLHLPWSSLLQWCRGAWWGGCGAQPVEENGLLCCEPFHNFSSYQRLFLPSPVTCFFSFILTKNLNVVLITFKAFIDCNCRGPQQLRFSHLPLFSYRDSSCP